MIIEQKIFQWLDTELPFEVIQAPYMGQQTESDFASFQILSIAMSEHNHLDFLSTDGTLTLANTVNYVKAQVTVLIEAKSAFSLLSDLMLSVDDYTVRNALLPITVNRVGNLREASFFEHTVNKGRWQVDFEIFASLTRAQSLNVLKGAIIPTF